MNIFKRMEHLVATPNEKAIIIFILRDPAQFLKLNSDEIGKECFVSSATLYRLCTKLEVSGLSELKRRIISDISNYQKEDPTIDYDFPLKGNEDEHDILLKIKENYEQTLISTHNLFKTKELHRVVQKMKQAIQIDIYTSAGNVSFAQNFKFQMQEIGVSIEVPSEEYSQRLLASSSNQHHFAIVISFGGRGLVMETIMRLLHDTETPVLLITATMDNPLKQYANYEMNISSFENHFYKISSFSTRLSLLYVLDCLYASYFELDYKVNLENKLRFYQRMREADK